MKTMLIAAAAALALAAGAGSANATIYNLSVFDAAFVPPVGTVTVTGEGTSTLSFNVQLASNFYFQQSGNGDLHDAFWFDLTAFAGAVTYNITAPNADGVAPGGDFPTDGMFVGQQFSSNAFGQGFIQNYDYALQVRDLSAGGNLQYYQSPLTFTVHADDNSNLTLASRSVLGQTVFGGADLRQCTSTSSTSGCIATGPVGFTLSVTPDPRGGGVPEPATWAMMIIGFGAAGSMIRRRKVVAA